MRDRTQALVRHLSDSLTLLPIIEHHVRHTATFDASTTNKNTESHAGASAAGDSAPESLSVIDVGTGVWSGEGVM